MFFFQEEKDELLRQVQSEKENNSTSGMSWSEFIVFSISFRVFLFLAFVSPDFWSVSDSFFRSELGFHSSTSWQAYYLCCDPMVLCSGLSNLWHFSRDSFFFYFYCTKSLFLVWDCLTFCFHANCSATDFPLKSWPAPQRQTKCLIVTVSVQTILQAARYSL